METQQLTTFCSNPQLHQLSEDQLLTDETAQRLAELFKVISDPTRLKIIGLLAHQEMCVGDLHLLLGMTQPAVSHQLRLLRHLQVVSSRKEGRHVFYTLSDNHIHTLFDQGLAHIQHQ
jgi:ArsR family transcriptional regulator